MSPLWSYFWPVVAVGLVIGLIDGLVAFRRRAGRNKALGIGLGVALALAALWHGPIGGADRFSTGVERSARQTLDDWEMTQVNARLHHGPLARRLILSGPADDFQRGRLVEIMGALPGVSRATWSATDRATPLIAEAGLTALLGFLLGLLLAYLVALRRRYNAQWKW